MKLGSISINRVLENKKNHINAENIAMNVGHLPCRFIFLI